MNEEEDEQNDAYDCADDERDDSDYIHNNSISNDFDDIDDGNGLAGRVQSH